MSRPRHARFHRLKGRIMKAAGWATADRHVEAKGASEAIAGRPPTDGEVEREELHIKAGYREVRTRRGTGSQH